MNKLRKLFLITSLILMLFITIGGVCATDITNDTNIMSTTNSSSMSVSNTNSAINTNSNLNQTIEDNKNINESVTTVQTNDNSDIKSNNDVSVYKASNLDNTQNVLNLADGKFYVTSKSQTYDNLDDAVSASSSTDTIIIGSGIYTGFDNKDVTLSKNLVIKAADDAIVIFNAENSGSNILNINPGYQITLNSLTFMNANNSFERTNYGGAILNLGNLNVINCTFLKNYCEYGGAIYNNGTLVIKDSNFINNTSPYEGGAIASESGKLSIFNSNFINNSGYFGGAIESQSPLYIENSMFKFNNGSNGGAIYGYDEIINISSSKFINNNAKIEGGALNTRGNLNVNSCDFINNSAENDGAIENYNSDNNFIIANINNSTFINNTATKYVGAVNLYANYSYITKSVFENNHALNGDIGALLINGKESYIYDSTFNNNNATATSDDMGSSMVAYGGAVFTYANLTVINSTFTNNKVQYGGGAIYASDNLNVTESTFLNNFAKYGGAIYSITNKLNVDYSVFYNNSASSYGNDVYSNGGTLNYNWWGSNYPKYGLTPETYVIMTFDSTQTSVLPNENLILTAKLNEYYNTSSKNYNYLSKSLPSRPITFTSSSGSCNPTKTDIMSSVNSVYTAPSSKGTYYLYAKIDSQELSLSVVVNGESAKIFTTVSGSDFTENYGDGLFYNSTLKDKNGNVLAGRIAKLTLTKPSTGASKTYWATSDSEGKFSLQINLASGYYTITTTYDGDSEYESSSYTNTITVNPQTKTSTSLTAYDFSESYGAAQNFTATLKDNNGNPIIGQHITLLLIKPSNKATKTYYASTDVKGNAYLEINLATGNYLVVCSYDGNSQYVSSTGTATITVTS